jgi:hypothetical protein
MPEVIDHRSSFIERTEYDRPSGELQITFSNGKTFSYADFPPALYTQFITSPSKGKFFHAHIREAFDAEEV